MVSKIEKLDYEGRGLAHIDGKVIFIPRCLPEEEVEVSVIEEKENYIKGSVTSIKEKSANRVPSFCPYAEECGGCTFDFVSYENSLE